MIAENETPKVFISYSSTQSQFALRLATALYENGVECVFDQWDAKPGDDLYFFMEKSVNDKSIDFVLVLCDESYQHKANNRDGSGVSTETIIMSPEVYTKREASRYIPIACEFDEKGNAYLPTFMNIRKYVSFNGNERTFSESMMELLRLIYDEPSAPKPALGKRPNFAEVQSLQFVQKLSNISSDIQHIAITNTVHARTLFSQNFTDEIKLIFDQWDSTLKQTGAQDVSSQISRLLPIVQIYLRTYTIVGPESPSGEISTVEDTLRFLRAKYCPGHSMNNPEAFSGIRYFLYLGLGGVLLKNHMYSVLSELLGIVYTSPYGNKSYNAFYPEDLVSDSKLKLEEFALSLGNQYVEPIVQFDMLLYYLKDDAQTPRRWWFPLLRTLISPRNLSFPMLSTLANESPQKDILSIFHAETKGEAIEMLNKVQPIRDNLFDSTALPKQFYDTNF